MALQGTLSTFVKPSATSGSVDGTGTLYRWDATIGDWVTHALGVPINLRFTDNQKLEKVADLFGARIAASATALPNSEPVTIKGGDLKVG